MTAGAETAGRGARNRFRAIVALVALVALAALGATAYVAVTATDGPPPRFVWTRPPAPGTPAVTRPAVVRSFETMPFDVSVTADIPEPDTDGGWVARPNGCPVDGADLLRGPTLVQRLLERCGLAKPAPRPAPATRFVAIPTGDAPRDGWTRRAVEQDRVPSGARPDAAFVGEWVRTGVPSIRLADSPAPRIVGRLVLAADGAATYDAYPEELRPWGALDGVVYLGRFGPTGVGQAPVLVAVPESTDSLRFSDATSAVRMRTPGARPDVRDGGGAR